MKGRKLWDMGLWLTVAFASGLVFEEIPLTRHGMWGVRITTDHLELNFDPDERDTEFTRDHSDLLKFNSFFVPSGN